MIAAVIVVDLLGEIVVTIDQRRVALDSIDAREFGAGWSLRESERWRRKR